MSIVNVFYLAALLVQSAPTLQAQAALRTMQKESAECPDRAMQDELEAEENEKNGKRDKRLKGRGRGRGGRGGRGRSGKGRGKGCAPEVKDDEKKDNEKKDDETKDDEMPASHSGDAEIATPPSCAVEEKKKPLIEPSHKFPPDDAEVTESPVKKPRLGRRNSRQKLQRLRVLSPSSSGKKMYKKRKPDDGEVGGPADATDKPGQEDQEGWDFRGENGPEETDAQNHEGEIPEPAPSKPKRERKKSKKPKVRQEAAGSANPEGPKQHVSDTPDETQKEKTKEEIAMEKAKEDKDLIENDVAVMWKRVISQVGQEVSNHHIIQSLSACRSFGNSMEYNTVPWVSHVLFHHLSGTFWYSIFGNAHVEIPLIQFDCRNKSGHSSSILQRKMPI